MRPASVIRSLLAVSMCTTAAIAGESREPIKTLLEMRHENVVIQKWDISCGAAALGTLLNYQHGDLVPENEIAKGLFQRDDYLNNPDIVRIHQGFSLLDLKRYVEGRGYSGDGLGALSFDDLLERAPIIVSVFVHGYNHFVVFRGMQGDRVLLADPAWGNRTMRREQFEALWIEYPKFGRVGFTVSRKDGLSPDNKLIPRDEEFVMLK